MSHPIRPATPADAPAIVALLPRLAAFEVPNGRAPEELWRDDRALVLAWAEGGRGDVDVAVATDADGEGGGGGNGGEVIGVAVISERRELLSGEPSAHLEILAVHERAEGSGTGSALLAEGERMARRRGLGSISLHVFAANRRALRLYERCGFDAELLRCFKRLG